MLVPRSDRKGSTVKGEPYALLRWWEFRFAISASINNGLFIVLNTIFFFPFMLFQGTEVSVGISMVWMEIFVFVLVVNWITFHIFYYLFYLIDLDYCVSCGFIVSDFHC